VLYSVETKQNALPTLYHIHNPCLKYVYALDIHPFFSKFLIFCCCRLPFYFTTSSYFAVTLLFLQFPFLSDFVTMSGQYTSKSCCSLDAAWNDDDSMSLESMPLALELSHQEENDSRWPSTPAMSVPPEENDAWSLCDSVDQYSLVNDGSSIPHRPSHFRDDNGISLDLSNDVDTNTKVGEWLAYTVAKKSIHFSSSKSVAGTNPSLGLKGQEEEQLLQGCQVSNVNLAVPVCIDRDAVFYYVEEAIQSNINDLNSHKGVVGEKARIQKTSTTSADPVPPSIRDADVAAVKKCMPSLNEGSPEALKMIRNVTRAAAKMCPPLTDASNLSDYEAAVETIFQSLKNILPQRALFNLMSRWARRSKNHFQRDALYVVTVLSHQLGLTCVDFLDKARTWEYSPILSTRRQSSSLAYVRKKKNDMRFDNVVNKFHLTCMMLDSSIKGKFVVYYFYSQILVSSFLMLFTFVILFYPCR
jgi:hypothetical protein